MFESHENKNKDRQEEEIFTVQKMFESLESILQMKEFNKDLREELSVSYPNADYMNVLNSTKINLVRDDCGIVIAGRYYSICFPVIYDLSVFNNLLIVDL